MVFITELLNIVAIFFNQIVAIMGDVTLKYWHGGVFVNDKNDDLVYI